jgi:hypothetical protein
MFLYFLWGIEPNRDDKEARDLAGHFFLGDGLDIELYPREVLDIEGFGYEVCEDWV